MDTISSAVFEGVCYRCVANFVNNSMELEKLLVNGKITAFWRTDVSQALNQMLQTTKMNFEKLLG